MSAPYISFIVTAWASRRPAALPVLFACLRAQTVQDWECLVLDSDFYPPHVKLCCQDDRVIYLPRPLRRIHEHREMYHVSEWGVKRAIGQYLCFASDDSYYVPWFSERMLAVAERESLDLVLSDLVLGSPQVHGAINSQPFTGSVDKTNFVIRRDKMIPFPGKDDPEGWKIADGQFVEELVRSGARWGKVAQPLVVHN